jgi:hypothetical protein
MSINSAIIDRRPRGNLTAIQRESTVIPAIRRLAPRPRWRQEPPYLNVGDSYRIVARGRGPQCGSGWIHTHH